MRFEYLGLERYGQFEKLALHLPPDRPLVIVQGPNEAGKTTLLQAIHDLLFGVGERTPYGFRFDLRAMSIRARLRDQDGRSLDLQRLKRRKASLVGTVRDGPEERPVGAGALAEYFGGIDRALYSSLFGFTQQDLQRGSEILRVAGLREVIGGSSLGGSGDAIRGLKRRLELEAEELFKPRGKNPAINHTLAQLKTTRASLREATFQQSQYLALTKRLSETRAEIERADTSLLRARERVARLRALLGAFEDFHEARALDRQLAQPELQSALAEHEATRVQTLLAELRERRRERGGLADDVEGLLARVERLAVDEPILAEAETITRLAKRAETIARARASAPLQQGELDQRRRALRAEQERLGVDVAEGDELAEPPAPLARWRDGGALLSRLRAACDRWSTTADQVHRLERDAAAFARESAELERELATLRARGRPDPALEQLLAELDDAQQRRQTIAQREMEQLRVDTSVELKRVQLEPRPPSLVRDDGSPRALALPSPTAIRAAQAQLQALEQARAANELAAQDARRQQNATRAELEVLLAAEQVPDPRELATLRGRREQLWAGVREAWAAGVSFAPADLFDRSHGQQLATDYAEAVTAADEFADRMRDAAERIAKRLALERQLARFDALLEQHDAAQRDHDDARREWARDWQALWETAGITPSSIPAEMLAWRMQVLELQDLMVHRVQAARAVEELRGDAERFMARARAALERDPETSDAAGQGWPSLVLALRNQQRERQALRGRLEATQERARVLATARARAEEELRVARDRARELRAALDDMFRDAAGITDTTTLEPTVALARAEQLALLARRAFELAEDARVHADAVEELHGFDRDAEALRQRLGASPSTSPTTSPSTSLERWIESLARRLEDARAAATARLHTQEQLEERRRRLARVERALAELEEELATLLGAAGCSEERALGREAERALERARALRRRADLETHLVRALGVGEEREELERELQLARHDQLLAERERLSAEIQRLDDQRTEQVERKGKLERELEQLGGDTAARLGAEEQELLAELGDQVERYATTRLARSILDAVTERHAREHQPAIIAETSRLLAVITGGRHVRVEPEPEADTLAIIGKDGRRRRPESLSTGTREQVFLAIRLAYVLEHCGRAEPLPLILDDALVTFDDERAGRTLEALLALTEVTQVLVLTCHRHLVELARARVPAAHIITLPGSEHAAA